MKKKDSIEECLLPVRVAVEYSKNERVTYLETASGEVLTVAVPVSWAYYMSMAINRRYTEKITKGYQVSDPIALIKIEGLPLQKSDSQIVGQDKQGNLVILENPAYTESIKKAEILGDELFLQRWVQLPITCPVMISCIYNVNGRGQYDIAQANAWVIDLLNRLNILHSKTHHIVKSMDGSRFRKIKEEPFILIVIRKVEDK